MKKQITGLFLLGGVFLFLSPLSLSAEEIYPLQDRKIVWPETYASHWAKDFFSALNPENDRDIKRFVISHYSKGYLDKNSLEKEVRNISRLKSMIGNFFIHTIEKSKEFTLSLIVKSEPFGWLKFQFTFSQDPPHDPKDIGVGIASPPSDEQGRHIGKWKNLSDLMSRLCRQKGIPALAAALIQSGEITEKAVYGVRCSGSQDSVRLEDRFHLGSVTKLFTGAMIEKLIERGILKSDIRIGDIFSDLKMRPEYRAVTLGQLLKFQGGIPGMPSTTEISDAFRHDFQSELSPAEGRKIHIQQILQEKSTGEPEKERYSNSSYVLAAHMAERITGRSWEELIQDEIFSPLKLAAAGFGWPAAKDSPEQPYGHNGSPPELIIQQIRWDPYGVHTYFGPSGDIQCSISDLAEFALFQLQALRNESPLLKGESVRRYWKGGKTEEGVTYYGFFGSANTFLSMIFIYPDSNSAVVAAANCGLTAKPEMEALRDAVHARIIRK